MATYLDLSGLQTYHNKLKTYIGTIQSDLETKITKKQDKLTAGTGIAISDENVISFTGDTTIFVYVDSLPDVSAAELNKIYVVASEKTETGNLYTEWYVKVTGTARAWEKVGEFKESIDLDNYYTKAETATYVSGQLADYVKSADVYTKAQADSTFVASANFITTAQIDNIFA